MKSLGYEISTSRRGFKPKMKWSIGSTWISIALKERGSYHNSWSQMGNSFAPMKTFIRWDAGHQLSVCFSSQLDAIGIIEMEGYLQNGKVKQVNCSISSSLQSAFWTSQEKSSNRMDVASSFYMSSNNVQGNWCHMSGSGVVVGGGF